MTLLITTSLYLIRTIVLSVALLFSSQALASDKVGAIVNKTLEAYGGEKLLSLKTISYSDSIDHFFSHQSGHALQGPISMHLNQVKIELFIGFENHYTELKRLNKLIVGYHDNRNVTATHRLFKDGQGYNIDHFLQEYQPTNHITKNNADLGYSQMLDPLIVKKLVSEKNEAKWVDTAFIEGRANEVLTVNAGTENEYSVYLDRTSGLLTRMLQKHGPDLRTYSFLNHQKTNGISWAKQMFVGTEKSPIYHTNKRHVEINSDQPTSLSIPKHYQESTPVKPVDVSQLTIRTLADGVFYVGQDWGYTLFVDVGAHYISAGAWGMSDRSDDWKKALKLLHKTTGGNKPVKFHLVSHHHTDHMSELQDVIEHGAKIIAHPLDIPNIKQFLAHKTLDDSNFTSIEKDTSLANGKIMLFDAPNSQASHNLVLYLPESKIVFAEDVFGSSFENKLHSPRSWPHMDTYQRLAGLTRHLKERGFIVDYYVSSHHGRVLHSVNVAKALETKLPSYDTVYKRLFQKEKEKNVITE